jgi:transcription initiation factor TFIID subunit 7
MNDRAPIRDRTLILRILVPGLEARLRDKMKEMEDAAAAPSAGGKNNAGNKDLCLDLEGVTCEPTPARNSTLWNFHCDGATYPAKLVNLPCPVEVHKTHDHAVYFKCADIAQMLIVYEDDMALEEADEKPVEGFPTYYHSGLTPPTKRVVERRFAAREHKALAPPRAAAAEVEMDLMELMEKIAKDEKGKRNKVPTLTSANKVLEDVLEEVVEYEPWMSDFGRQLHGVEFESDDQLCSLHPEVWLDPADIRETKEKDEEAKRKKEEVAQKKGAKRKEKKLLGETKTTKKGIASKKNTVIVDEVTQAATSMLTSDDLDLMAEDALFDDLDLEDEDMDFDLDNLNL